MYKIKVNDKFAFQIAETKEGLKVNDELITVDSAVNGKNANIIYKNGSYNVELVTVNDDKTIVIKVNGTEYRVAIEDKYAALLHQLGFDNLAAGKVLELKAPMPGLVLSILVEEGQEVKKGDNLIILEAMKMENILKSPSDAVIRKISIKIGDKLEKNTVLIQFA